jgi:predicted dehydrogenase
MPHQKHKLSRRRFLQTTAAAGTASAMLGSPSLFAQDQGPNEKLNLGIVGCGNKGWHNVEQLRSENIVALCDVDENYLNKAAEQFPDARRYRDYRKMLEAEVNRIDGVVVSTADHCHAPATSVALDLKKHVYCEKPLTHTVAEARAISELARKQGVATQMGTQIHASSNYRRVVEIVQSGALGNVSKVFCWCNKNWSGGKFAVTDQPAPANLDWDLWLGPAAERPYSPNIHPGNWRRFWEYGSGTFGDMACHVLDLPFWAMRLTRPTQVACEGPKIDPDGTPAWTKATYDFPAIRERGAVQLHWSDGGKHFDEMSQMQDYDGKPLKDWGLGTLFVGDKGMLVADYGRYQLFPREDFADFTPPEKSIPESIGHWNEWIAGCKSGSPTLCNFDYAGLLTETVLLGIVAYRCGSEISLDPQELKATNTDAAEQFLTKRYRKGFEVVGLKS